MSEKSSTGAASNSASGKTTRKKPRASTQAWSRSLSATMAGARAGSALALDSAVQQLFKKSPRTENQTDSTFADKEAQRFVSKLGKLKGSYIKIGQMLALFGEHFLPPALTRALHKLDSSTQALDWQEIEPLIKANLDERFDQLDIEQQAIAAASLSQVHRASIKASGQTLCLKVQYPNLAEVIDADFDAVVKMLVLARWLKKGQELDDWLSTMREQLHNEINYLREAELTQQAALLAQSTNADNSKQSKQYCQLYVPQLFSDYCSGQLLALEYIDAYSVTAEQVKQLSLQRRNVIAKTMLDLFFREVFEWGLLQTDPNFGNYLIELDDRRKRVTNDKLVLLDFGAAMILPATTLHYLQQVIVAGQEQNIKSLISGLLGLGWLKANASEEACQTFAMFCVELLEPLRKPAQLPAEYLNKRGEYCWAKSNLMQRAGKQGAANASSRHFTPPARDFVLIARKLTGVFTFISVLNAEFNAYPIAQKTIEQWHKNNSHR